MRVAMKSVLLLGTLALSLVTAAQEAQSVPQNGDEDGQVLSVQRIASETCISNCGHSARSLIPSNTRSIPGLNTAETEHPSSSSRSDITTSAPPTKTLLAKGFGKAKTVTKYFTTTVYRAPTVTVAKTPATVYKTKTKTKTVSVVNGTAAATEYSEASSDGWSIGEAGMWFGGLAGFNVALVMVVFL